MRVHGVVLTVLLAPLVGTTVWLLMQMRDMLAFGSISTPSEYFDDPFGLLQFALLGWFIGLLITLLVGLPLGFLVAFVLRKLSWESGLTYPLFGFSLGYFAGLAFGGLNEFALPGAATGLLLGIGYWRFVRIPRLQNRSDA